MLQLLMSSGGAFSYGAVLEKWKDYEPVKNGNHCHWKQCLIFGVVCEWPRSERIPPKSGEVRPTLTI